MYDLYEVQYYFFNDVIFSSVKYREINRIVYHYIFFNVLEKYLFMSNFFECEIFFGKFYFILKLMFFLNKIYSGK